MTTTAGLARSIANLVVEARRLGRYEAMGSRNPSPVRELAERRVAIALDLVVASIVARDIEVCEMGPGSVIELDIALRCPMRGPR